MLAKFAPYLLSVALLLLGLSIGFAIGKNMTPPSSSKTSNGATVVNPTTQNAELYSSQTASIRGEIIRRDGNNITIKNLTTQATGELHVSSNVVISKFSTKPGESSPSSSLSSIALNKEALINLQINDGAYEVVSITYTLPNPSLPPLAR